jgi:hypothetical protein
MNPVDMALQPICRLKIKAFTTQIIFALIIHEETSAGPERKLSQANPHRRTITQSGSKPSRHICCSKLPALKGQGDTDKQTPWQNVETRTK